MAVPNERRKDHDLRKRIEEIKAKLQHKDAYWNPLSNNLLLDGEVICSLEFLEDNKLTHLAPARIKRKDEKG